MGLRVWATRIITDGNGVYWLEGRVLARIERIGWAALGIRADGI
jgi:hypothetical protein